MRKQWLGIRQFSMYYIVVWFFGLCLLCMPKEVYAQAFSENVKYVKNEKAMLKDMIRNMKQHKLQMAYCYPGIETDFAAYRKQSASYTTFFDQLIKYDGYITGVVSGCCITVKGEDEKYVLFQFGYLTTKKQERMIDKKVRKIVKRIGKGSNAQKAKRIHDYLISHMKYDTKYYSPYDAFAKGKGMCMAYALAYQRVMQETGIPCVYVKGKNHAWNLVKIGKYWYNVDVTWDDRKNGRYRYFLKSDRDFYGHKRPKSKYLSSLKMAKKSYFVNSLKYQ